MPRPQRLDRIGWHRHRRLSSSFAVVTGHEDDDKDAPAVGWASLATAVDTLVGLMRARALPGIVARLLGHGRPPDTPVALVRWGTTDAQQTLTGTLADIVARTRTAALAPPAVAVIGRVAGLRETLRWFDAPLREDSAGLGAKRRVTGTAAHR